MNFTYISITKGERNMRFNQHTNLEGCHAPFSASQSVWLRYSDEKALVRYANRNRKLLGSELHDFVKSQISLCQKVTNQKQLVQNITTFIYSKYQALNNLKFGLSIIKDIKKLPKEVFETLKIYINDAIGFGMDPEVVLFYSERFFGTADAISFRNNILRIHDLKTGELAASMDQLLVYVALFCLEYNIKPSELDDIELRIYQSTEITIHNPAIEEIVPIMDKIMHLDKLIEKADEEV